MPPKRTPPRARTPKVKTPKMPEVRTRDSSVEDETTSVATIPAGLSPEFLAFMQMQEKLRAEERADADRLRAEEKADAEKLRDILENRRKDEYIMNGAL